MSTLAMPISDNDTWQNDNLETLKTQVSLPQRFRIANDSTKTAIQSLWILKMCLQIMDRTVKDSPQLWR